jgi:hypothetical protein
LQQEIDTGKASSTQFNALYDIQKQKIDVEIEKNASMNATTLTTIASMSSGLRAVSFNMFRNFKIQSVTDAAGQPLDYVFEEGSFSRYERDDPENFTVILLKPLGVGEQITIKTVYGGKEAVTNEGGGNYYPVARDDWFPASRLGDSADFEITFRIPKGMKIAATGSMVSETTDGDHAVSEWKSDAPIWVAGFNFGRFKMMETKLPDGMMIRSYANESQPDCRSPRGKRGRRRALVRALRVSAASGIHGRHVGRVAFSGRRSCSWSHPIPRRAVWTAGNGRGGGVGRHPDFRLEHSRRPLDQGGRTSRFCAASGCGPERRVEPQQHHQ